MLLVLIIYLRFVTFILLFVNREIHLHFRSGRDMKVLGDERMVVHLSAYFERQLGRAKLY